MSTNGVTFRLRGYIIFACVVPRIIIYRREHCSRNNRYMPILIYVITPTVVYIYYYPYHRRANYTVVLFCGNKHRACAKTFAPSRLLFRQYDVSCRPSTTTTRHRVVAPQYFNIFILLLVNPRYFSWHLGKHIYDRIRK